RAREAIEQRERELAEVERRRNLMAEERSAEDAAFLAGQQLERDGRGKMSYMQKYHHRGAFFQEEAAAAGLLQRDIMGTRIADDARNREALPAYLQRRDMSKLGKKGATKYRDMRSEDTGRWGEDHLDRGRRGGGEGRQAGRDGGSFSRPEDDRFRPDERDAKGANAVPLGDREKRVAPRRGGRDGCADGKGQGRSDEFRPGDSNSNRGSPRSRSRPRSPQPPRPRSRSRSRARSRSRSPPSAYHDDRHRKRSTSRSRHRHQDKRRRVDDR
ncbi:hypothetical protein E4U41_004629, partial [Claviceps citrina]